jgi:membrane protein
MAASSAAPSEPTSGFSQYVQLLKTAWAGWGEHKATKLAAALAFYTMLSIAPLLIISIKIVGKVTNNSGSAKTTITNYLSANAGEKAAKAASDMIEAAGKETPGSTFATILSIFILIMSASGVFGELQDSLNTIFEVKPKPDRGILGIIKDRFFSMTLVLGTAFLLLVSLVASTVLTGMTKRIGGEGIVFEVLNFVLSLAVASLLFSLMFKYLPDVKLHWRNVFIGGTLTAVLFTIGKFGLGWYLGRGSTTSIYGAAGSLVAMLLWVYYTGWILFFGAEFTRAYAMAHGDGKQPEGNAVKVTEEDKAKQGRASEGRVAAAARNGGKVPPSRPARTYTAPQIPAYSFSPTGADGGRKSYLMAGAGVVVGALAGALGAKSLMNDPSRPTRKHIQAVALDRRLNTIEQKVGRVSRIQQHLQDADAYERIIQVEKQIRHARTALRSEQNRRPSWLVRLGDLVAGNK